MVTVDLHLHTTASDGRLSPTELVNLVAQSGIQVMALTDHDSTEGLEEAFAAAQDFDHLEVIPGIELGTDIPGSEIHMLAYFVQHTRKDLQEELSRLRSGRQDRGRLMVEKLRKSGLDIEWERVQEIAGDGSVGRPHVALAMVEKGYVKEPKDAFETYLGRNGIAYVEREKMTPTESIGLIKSWGGVPVLAHPSYVPNLDSILGDLKKAGLAGMEVFYAEYSPEKIRELADIASEYDLLPCGGSDYHAIGNTGEPLPGSMGPPVEVVEQLRSMATPGS